jgi:hypothetical protein
MPARSDTGCGASDPIRHHHPNTIRSSSCRTPWWRHSQVTRHGWPNRFNAENQAVIEGLTRVAYHPGHTWKLLRRMGWRQQRPARRAVERDERAIARWVAEDWP